jgi:hypothetical protein
MITATVVALLGFVWLCTAFRGPHGGCRLVWKALRVLPHQEALPT